MKKAFSCVVAASVLWGTSGLFIHVMKPLGFSSLQMTAIRGVVSAVFLHIYALVKDPSVYRVSMKELAIFLFSGLCVYGTAACYYSAVIASSVSTAVILMYTAPVYVMAFSVTFLGEKIRLPKLLAILLMIVGCALVSGIFGGMKFNVLGILFGIASGIIYSGYNILTRIGMMRGSNSISATLYAYTVMAIVGLVVCKPVGILEIAVQNPLAMVPLMIAMGICTCTMPFFLYTLALRDIPAGTASALGILEPVSATVFSVVFLQETLTTASFCGILLVLAAVMILNRCEARSTG